MRLLRSAAPTGLGLAERNNWETFDEWLIYNVILLLHLYWIQAINVILLLHLYWIQAITIGLANLKIGETQIMHFYLPICEI